MKSSTHSTNPSSKQASFSTGGYGKGVARRIRRVVLAVGFCGLLSHGPAYAQPVVAPDDKAAARSLFVAARKLMKQNKYDEACPMLARSLRHYRTIAAMLNLALCHDRQGKTATAWAEYAATIAAAKEAGDAERAKLTEQLVAELKPRLSQLTIVVSVMIPGLKVFQNETEIAASSYGQPLVVDPGEYRIRASAPGYDWSTTVVVGGDGDRQTVNVRPGRAPTSVTAKPPASVPPPTPPPTPPDSPPHPARGLGAQHYAAIGAGGLGLVGIVLGAVFGAKANASWQDAKQHPACHETAEGPYACVDDGLALADEATTYATVSTVGFVVGGVGLAAGLALWFTAPNDEQTATAVRRSGPSVGLVRIVPAFSSRHGELLVTGRF